MAGWIGLVAGGGRGGEGRGDKEEEAMPHTHHAFLPSGFRKHPMASPANKDPLSEVITRLAFPRLCADCTSRHELG